MRRTLMILTATLTAFSACHHGGPHLERAPGINRSAPPAAEASLTEVGIAIPIRPGKTDAWMAKLADLTGPRYEEYASSRQRYGLTSQTTFLQRTPMGDFALIHLTGDDVHASFHRMSTSQDPWDVSWREMTLDLHGVDFAKGDSALPTVEAAFSMDSGTGRGQPFMFVAPLDASKCDEFKALSAQLAGPDHAHYVASRQRLGISREAAFLEHTTMGDAVVFYWVADAPQASLRKLAASTDPFDVRMATTVARLHPLPMTALQATVAGNVLVGQYPQQR